MANNMLLTIEKLQGRKNYSTWKTQMRYYLSHEEFWDLVSTRPDGCNLQSAYEDKGVNRRCILLGKLFDVKLKNFNNMENYVTQVLKTAQEIASTGKALDDDLIARNRGRHKYK
jgi:hypothetical protein